MSQQEIIDILERAKMPISAKEISKITGMRDIHVWDLLRKIMKQKNSEIKCIQLNRHQALKHFKSKRVLRLYYISTFNKRDFSKAKSALSYL